MIRPLIFFAVLSGASSAVAQTYRPASFPDADRQNKIASATAAVDKIYQTFAEKNHAPGIVYGIVADGKLVHSGQAGYTNISSKTAVTPASAFRIASMTKSIVAMAILKLRDEGKLKLDDPASLYIPEFKNLKYLTTDASPITIRNLLTHGAGFPEDNPWGDRQLAISDDELTAFYKKGISFSNDPGLTYEYSNLGFTTLGHIIKRVTGQSYEQYVTESILKPLGMTHTYWEYSSVPGGDLAHGYRWLADSWVEQPMLHDGAYGAMGGLITTLEDFSKYVALHLDAWPPRDETETGPVKRSSVREMQFPWNVSALRPGAKGPDGKSCPSVSAYGYGLAWTRDCNDNILVGHSGGLPGFGSNWRILPQYGIGVICFANVTYAAAGTPNGEALYTILSVSGIHPRVLPPSKILTQRRDELVKLLPDFTNAEKSSTFAMNFFMDYFVPQLQQEARTIFSQAGKIKSVSDVVPENNLRGFFIISCEKGNVRVAFTLTPEPEAPIQEYHIELVK